jgi:hypothetical protein
VTWSLVLIKNVILLFLHGITEHFYVAKTTDFLKKHC